MSLGIFDPAIFDPAIFDTGAPPASGFIPRGSTVGVTMPGVPTVSVAVPGFGASVAVSDFEGDPE